MKANKEEAEELRHILALYENCSGQCINPKKSTVMFSRNTPHAVRNVIKETLVIHSEAWNEKYLGLPVYVGRSKRKAFAYLKDKNWARIQGWMEKLLAKAGKEILVKAVAQAIPSYAMSCFILLKNSVMN
jgi:hypothetical protein